MSLSRIKTTPVQRGREHSQRPPSFEQIASDSRFTVSELAVPGLPGNPAVDVLLAAPVDRPSGRPVLFTTHGGGLITGNNRFGLHGGSAGGNLAAGLALRARDSGEVRPRGQVLLYPMLDDRNESLSAQQMRGRGIWDDVSNRTAWDSVLGELRNNPPEYAAPARARTLSNLPPTYLEAGSAETFRDETVAYAQRIWSCGGDAELHIWPGAFHGFDLFVPDSTVARRARTTRRDWITRLLS